MRFLPDFVSANRMDISEGFGNKFRLCVYSQSLPIEEQNGWCQLREQGKRNWCLVEDLALAECFDSKGTSGLCQAVTAAMPPLEGYILVHPLTDGGGKFIVKIKRLP